ncbi:hypothetical protein [Micropruina sp.]|uniref:hypothetical protein n=1 Tax=Micropruina sp. TaxID=2737536 RepID=UPI0039E34915
MEIVLSLVRTLVFVVGSVAATGYVGRRIGRGRSLLWAGTTLLALYWLVLFGWTAYQAGSAAPNGDLGVWVGWLGHLLPFVAALSYIGGIAQAAGVPARTGVHGGASAGPIPIASPPIGGFIDPAGEQSAVSTLTQPPGAESGTVQGRSKQPTPFAGPHAVPVVTAPVVRGKAGPAAPSKPPSGDDSGPEKSV